MLDGENGVVTVVAKIKARFEASEKLIDEHVVAIHRRISLHMKWPAWIFGGVGAVLAVIYLLWKMKILSRLGLT